jgi:hypothetical protein
VVAGLGCDAVHSARPIVRPYSCSIPIPTRSPP